VMPPCYVNFHQRMKKFVAREDDVWVASFPKCGTTWTQEMVWNIMNDLDLEAAKRTTLDDRVPFLEISGIIEEVFSEAAIDLTESTPEGGSSGVLPCHDSMQTVCEMPTDKPRIIKTHLSVELMPQEVLDKNKIIYVARNPRDVVISYYNHWKIMEGYSGDFNSFFDAFMDDVSGYYVPFFSHNIGYWNIRNQKNVMFIFYEDMKKDLKSVIRKVSTFLQKQLTEDQVDILNGHLQFDSMKDNPAVNKQAVIDGLGKATGIPGIGDGKFMNKGKAGGWRSKLTEQQIETIKAWEQKHLHNTDLTFQYD